MRPDDKQRTADRGSWLYVAPIDDALHRCARRAVQRKVVAYCADPACMQRFMDPAAATEIETWLDGLVREELERTGFRLSWAGDPNELQVVPLAADDRQSTTDDGPRTLDAGWGRPIVELVQRLAETAADRRISDADFLDRMDGIAEEIPDLVRKMDVDVLAAAMESSMSAAAMDGVFTTETQRTERKPVSAFSVASVVRYSVSNPVVRFEPMAEAIARMDRKTPIGALLSSAQWKDVPIALRERAMFSARVASVHLLTAMQEKLRRRIAMEREAVGADRTAFVDRGSFIADMRAEAESEGIDTTNADPKLRGTVRDIRSAKRLGLVFDMQDGMAKEYARWKMDHDPDVLDEFPAQRFTRVEARDRRRQDWPQRWAAAGAAVNWQGALKEPMVALKTSPIWTELSEFGTPWPPFDWGSGMGVEDVDRQEAEALGLLTKDAAVPRFEKGSDERGFNSKLEASVQGLGEKTVAWLLNSFGDRAEISGDRIRWRDQ